MSDQQPPLPQPDALTASFWEACRRGALEVSACEDCGHLFLPPGPCCPKCWSTQLTVRPVSGRGRVFSFVVYRRTYHPGMPAPYVVALVELTEGPRLISNIVGCGPEEVAIDKPIIAAVNGHCLAGGLEIALACDLRIASENATFGLPEVTRGIMPGAGGTQRLPRLVGPERALDLILTGRRIDAAEAERIGLVTRVCPLDDLQNEALATARAIAENGPLAVRAAKAAVWRGLDVPLEEGLRLEQLLAEPVRQSEDAQEGPRAFLEKRKPEFKGR